MKGVYKIINIITNKYYIGSSNNIEDRLKTHFRELKNNRHPNKHLQSSYNKYGKDNFSTSILEECDNIIEREQFYIDNSNWNMLYNKTRKAGGGGGDTTSKEYVLLDLDGNVLDRFYSGRILKDFLNIKARDIDYKSINTDNKFFGIYRIVSLDFFENNKDEIYKWKNYCEIYG